METDSQHDAGGQVEAQITVWATPKWHTNVSICWI